MVVNVCASFALVGCVLVLRLSCDLCVCLLIVCVACCFGGEGACCCSRCCLGGRLADALCVVAGCLFCCC